MVRRRRLHTPRKGSDLARFLAVAASAGAAEIHLVMSPVHWGEWWPSGVFFIVIGAFQAVWAVLALWRSEPSLMYAGAAANAGSIGLWAVSRVVGLPGGPHAWVPEPAGMVDLITVAFEVVVVTGSVWALRSQDTRTGSGRGLLGTVTVAVLAVAFSTAAAVSNADEHSHAAEPAEHGGSKNEEQGCADDSETATPAPEESDDEGSADDGHDHEH